MDINMPGVSRYIGDAADINAMSDREALGTAEGFRSCRFDSIKGNIFALKGSGNEELAAVVESAWASLADRLAAGILLGLMGDHRLAATAPCMAEVPRAQVKIGTSPTEVGAICARHPDLGLKEEWLIKETPSFEINLEAFRIGKYPVTNIEYRRFLVENPRETPPTSWPFGYFPLERSNHPVYSVRPEAADRYCRWLSEKTGRLFRLPTEFEWEYAAAGSTGLEYPWGDEFDTEAANTLELGLFRSVAVGSFAKGASPFGVFDMAGTVEEYVSDCYMPYPGGEFVRDDLVSFLGDKYRVARGGSFTRFRDMARCRRRHGGPLDRSFYVMGFRLAETITS